MPKQRAELYAAHLGQTRAIRSQEEKSKSEFGEGMKKTKTTEITFETDELFIIKKRDESTHIRCETCGPLVRMVSIAEAASITRADELAICEQVKARLLHSTVTPEGQVLICLNSLLT
jgi:hypothetical protein